MAVYTSFEMIEDCKRGEPRAWIYFVDEMVPALRWLYTRYGLGAEALRAGILATREKIGAFEPMTQREFVAELRPHPQPRPGSRIGLESVAGALGELTTVERQIVWFDTMGYSDADAARLMRLSEQTAAGAREKGAEMLRAALDHWSRSMLREDGAALGAEARAAVPEEKVPFREYLSIIDGRATWQDRAGVERKLKHSWHEIDQFCRVREADAAVSESAKLTGDEAQAYLDLLGVSRPKPSLWKRLMGR